ncbi:MAG: glycosyltransferase family 2 protein, partial [bacterium]
LYTDTDLSTPLEELTRLLARMENADVVIGSRYMNDSTLDIGLSHKRHLVSTVFNVIRRLILLPSIHDSQCGFKIFTYTAAQQIFPLQTLSGFAFDMELLVIANEQHMAIKEIGVTWTDDNQGKLRVIPTSLQMLRDMIKIRSNVFFGKYRNSK